jgi:hypothetical protein
MKAISRSLPGFLLFATSLFAPTFAVAAASRPPNVVVILSDDQGYA